MAPARSEGFFAALAPRGKAVLFALTAIGVCLLFAFPVFWLVLTSLRPGTGVYTCIGEPNSRSTTSTTC